MIYDAAAASIARAKFHRMACGFEYSAEVRRLKTPQHDLDPKGRVSAKWKPNQTLAPRRRSAIEGG